LEWDWVHLLYRPLLGLLYQPRMINEYGAVDGMTICKENTYPSVILSITNSTRHCLGLNPGRRGWKPETNRLSYGTAYPTNSSEHDNYNIADMKKFPAPFIFLRGWDSAHLVLGPLFGLLHQPQMIDDDDDDDDDDCGAIDGMLIGRANRSTRRKPVSVLLCPPQIPHDLSLARTRAAAVGSRRLTAWAVARPNSPLCMETEG
jgi:hypothetical protein